MEFTYTHIYFFNIKAPPEQSEGAKIKFKCKNAEKNMFDCPTYYTQATFLHHFIASVLEM